MLSNVTNQLISFEIQLTLNPSKTPETALETTLYSEQYAEYSYGPDTPELP